MKEANESPHTDLQIAEAAMRQVLREPGSIAPADGASLDRMLAHVVNMREALLLHPERRPNVAKRLGDFAAAASRMMNRHPGASPNLSRLSEALQTASRQVQASAAAG